MKHALFSPLSQTAPFKTLLGHLNVPQTTALYGLPEGVRAYLAAAIRSGLTTGLPEAQSGSFPAEQPITGAQAAVMIQNALDLQVSQTALEAETAVQEEIPVWAASSVAVLQGNGLTMDAQVMNRGDMAQVLYQVSKLALHAPGMEVLQMQ